MTKSFLQYRKGILIGILIITAVLACLVAGADATAEKTATIYFFYGDGCPHCAHQKPFLDELKNKYPLIDIKSYETWKNPENAKLFSDMAKAYGVSAQGVPATFIHDKVWIGYADYMNQQIEDKLKSCMGSVCIDPGEVLRSGKSINDFIIQASNVSDEPSSLPNELCIHAFIIGGCPQCTGILPFLESMKDKHNIGLEVHDVTEDANKELFLQYKKIYGVQDSVYPIVFMGDKYLVGASAIEKNLDQQISICKEKGCLCPMSKILGIPPHPPQPKDITPDNSTIISLPFVGEIDTSNMSLPLFTILLAGLDSFNPCAFFVLFFLLSMLIYARSRARMLLIGTTFVFFSGLIYFFFMAAWLNLFLLIGQLMVITTIAGLIAVAVGLINIKDYFFFKKGVSLSIPEKAKPKLFDRMRGLLKASSLASMMVGTIFLAIAANSYELLCTAGFPMVFTRILTLNGISTGEYYLYLALYNLVYVIPLLFIVLIFTITLGAKKLNEWQGQVLKLISGLMMLTLGAILLINPALLNNIVFATAIIAAALAVAGIIVLLTKGKAEEKNER